jgi:capsular polysaccharide biosynthesis protein
MSANTALYELIGRIREVKMPNECKLLNWFSSSFSIFDRVPSYSVLDSVIYLPLQGEIKRDPKNFWGLYREDGTLVSESAHVRGPGKNLVSGQLDCYQDLSSIEGEDAPPANYLYGGVASYHYGHFLLSTLSRFWLGIEKNLTGYKIVCHGTNIQDWFSQRIVREIFDAIGLKEDQFVIFNKPTRLRNIIVPGTSYQEGNFAHRVFAEWGNKVGSKLTDTLNAPKNYGPVYFSKSHLSSGVQRIVNEQELTRRLESEGVKVLFPEEMSVAEQVLIYQRSPVIMASVGSALHTSIFCKPSAKIIGITPHLRIDPNYGIVDMVNGNDSAYLYAPCVEVTTGERSRFVKEFELSDPIAAAEAMLRAANHMVDERINIVHKQDTDSATYFQAMHPVTYRQRAYFIEN